MRFIQRIAEDTSPGPVSCDVPAPDGVVRYTALVTNGLFG